MSHFRTNRIAASSSRKSTRRNFFDDDIEQEEKRKNQNLQDEIDFTKRYGHYFDARDIKKHMHLLKTDPVAFENFLATDPEVEIRRQTINQKEVEKHSLILKGQEQLKKWQDEYISDNYSMDEQGIQHFKPKSSETINSFNDEFSKYSSVVESYIRSEEDTHVEDHRNNIIKQRRDREESEKAGLPKQLLQDTLEAYSKEVTSFEKKKKATEKQLKDKPNDVTMLHTLTEIKDYLTQAITKKTIIDDLVNERFKAVEFGSEVWFEKYANKDIMDTFISKYSISKYLKTTFRYNRNYKNHKVCFIPSGGGKSTLERMYGAYVFDVDKLLDYEADKQKFKFLLGYARFTNQWIVVNNYWKELINMYEHKFRGKVLLCHNPDQLPIGMITQRNQGLVILPSVKRWDLRSFKSNYEALLQVKDHLRLMTHYRYYFFNIYHYFKLNLNSWHNMTVR